MVCDQETSWRGFSVNHNEIYGFVELEIFIRTSWRICLQIRWRWKESGRNTIVPHQQQHEFAFALLCPGKQLNYVHKSVTNTAVRKSRCSGCYPALQINNDYKIAVKVFYVKSTKDFCDKCFTREDFESDYLPPDVEKKFKNLARVAFEGIKEGKLIHGGNEVRGMEDSPLFHRLPDRQTSALQHERQFCFIHLTMQEFFAARHLTTWILEKIKEICFREHQERQMAAGFSVSGRINGG